MRKVLYLSDVSVRKVLPMVSSKEYDIEEVNRKQVKDLKEYEGIVSKNQAR